MRLLRLALLAVPLTFTLLPQICAAQTTAARPRITERIDQNRRVTLSGNRHPLARPEVDRGAVADSQPIRRILLLLRRGADQESELRQLLDDQQTAASPHYHEWLTPEEFGNRFGPADADVTVVTGWLQSQGFSVDRVAAGKNVIEFSGTAGQVREAFGTEIHRYLVDGEERMANAGDPQIPAALAEVVAGPVSLHNFPAKPLSHTAGVFTKSRDTGVVTPLFTFNSSGCGSSNTCNALGPGDFAAIYNVQQLWSQGIDGTGQTIAIAADSNILAIDIDNFRSTFGLPPKPVTVLFAGPNPGYTSGELEADLDAEWAGAIAKNATIVLVVGEPTEATHGFDLAAEYAVDSNVAPVLSSSFGECEGALGTNGNAFEYALWEQAAAQGISVFVAAGDSGSAGCDNRNLPSPNAAVLGTYVSGIASTPFNVAVGGTDFDITAPNYQAAYWGANATVSGITGVSAKSYVPEIPWNDSCAQGRNGGVNGCSPPPNSSSVNILAGGGGPSNCSLLNAAGTLCQGFWPKPAWQPVAAASGLTPATDLARDIPDVSLFSSPGLTSNSFYIVCSQHYLGRACFANSSSFFSFLGVGGTSAAAPAFAAIMALVNQNMANHGLPARQGNANYVLYHLAANQNALNCNASNTPNPACSFQDVTLGNNSVPCAGGSPACGDTAQDGAYGILEQTNSNGVPNGVAAFNAGPGYDLATGLGSVNAYNLVTNWPAAVGGFTPTSTSFCLSTAPTTIGTCVPGPITAAHGTRVYVNAAVTPDPGASTASKPELVSLIGVPDTSPTGNPFVANSYSLSNVNAFPLAGGAASGSTISLTGGSYAAKAHYSGDGTYGSSDSASVNVTVNAEPSTTTVSSKVVNPVTGQVITANSAPYGYEDLIRIDVVGTNSGLQSGTGFVRLIDHSRSFGDDLILNAEAYAEEQTFLAAGVHSFDAGYSGDASYNGSTSALYSFTVTPASTSTTVSANAILVAPNTSIIVTAFVDTTSLGIEPAGNVTFFANGAQIGSPVNVFQIMDTNGFVAGSASLSVTVTATETITATYNSDFTNYLKSTSSGLTITTGALTYSVGPQPNTATLNVARGKSATQTITVSESVGANASVSFSCTVTPSTGIPPTCGMAPPSVALTPTILTGQSTMTLQSTAGSVVFGPAGKPAPPNPAVLYETAGILAVIAMWVAMADDRRRSRALLATATAVVLFTAVSCGGGGNTSSTGAPQNTGTTPGTYTVTVKATPSTGSPQQTTITVNVQ